MPKLQLKTITQQSFEVDIETTSTILQLKQKIAETKGEDEYPVESQKLIFNGKVLDDEMAISELNIPAGKFIVVMVVKKIVPKTSSAPTQSAAAPEKTTPSGEGGNTVKKEESGGEEKNLEVPSEHTATVDNITAMGYPREEVIRALKAAFYNADRAVEYLCTGIPEGTSAAQEAAAGDEASGDEEEVGNPAEALAFLADSPQFQQLREMVRANPTTLPQIVQQIAESNPQLMEIIRANQAQFLALLNAEANLGAGGNAQPAAAVAAAAGGGGGAAAGAEGGAARQRIAIPVTQEDQQAINRLCGMGFPEALVIEAYLACDKNEDLAVNYILQRMEENQGGS